MWIPLRLRKIKRQLPPRVVLIARGVARQIRPKERRPKVMLSTAGRIYAGSAAIVTVNVVKTAVVKAAEKVTAKAAGTITDAGNAGKERTASRAKAAVITAIAGNAATVTVNTVRILAVRVTVKAAEKILVKAAGIIMDAGNAGKELTASRAKAAVITAIAGNVVTVTAVNAMKTVAVTVSGNGTGTSAIPMRTLKMAARNKTVNVVPAGIVITGTATRTRTAPDR